MERLKLQNNETSISPCLFTMKYFLKLPMLDFNESHLSLPLSIKNIILNGSSINKYIYAYLELNHTHISSIFKTLSQFFIFHLFLKSKLHSPPSKMLELHSPPLLS